LAPAVASAAGSPAAASPSVLAPGAPVAPSAPKKPAVAVSTKKSATVVELSSTSTGLRRGDSGPAVRKLQLKLRAHGQHYVVADGSFGRVTQRGVEVVQRAMHLKVTGVANVAFLRKLGLEVVVVAATVPTPAAPTPRVTKYLRAFPIVGTSTDPYSTSKYPYADAFGTLGAEGPIQGADLPAAKGTPVVAVCNATVIDINRVATGLGGVWIWLQDVTGNQYYYAHLNSISAVLNIGSELRTGQDIGTVGNSGDAESGAPYLYLEVHPGGGAAIDPFHDLNVLEPAAGTS
jgi:murein DD-endopeptidase MepM/ murein hydrolase activator NlpD